MTNNKQGQEQNVKSANNGANTFVEKNKKALLGALIAVVVIIGGYFGYKYLYIQPLEEKAEAAIFKGEQYFGLGAFNEALNGDNKGYIGFIKIIDQYGGTPTANLAKAYAGICYAQMGKSQEAIKYLDQFDVNDDIVKPATMGIMGNCYANLNELDKATSFLTKAAEKADNNSLSPIYLMQAGLIFEKQGKFNDALTAYNKIKDKYFASYQAMEIDKYIERASAEGATK